MLQKLFLTLSLITCASMLGMHEKQQHSARGLTVFFTGLEAPDKSDSPCSTQATDAIHQKASPILISKNVLHNAIQEESRKYKNNLFKYHEWIIRKAGEHFLVLVPASYLIEKNISSKPSEKQITDDINDNTTATDFELELGLRLDHLEHISEEEFYNEIKTRTLPEQVSGENRRYIVYKILPQEFAAIIYDAEKNASNLFVLNKEYYHKKNPKPQWIIYWHGHGANNLIGELSTQNFLLLLDFLDTKITATCLTLFSCFTGKNLEKVFNKVKSLSYTIIGTSLSCNVANIDSGKTYLFWLFFKLFEQATVPKKENIIEACEGVMRFKNNYNNMPMIKYPGDTAYKPLDLDHTFTIDITMGNVRKQLIDLVTTFPHKKHAAKTPGVIFLYANQIKFPLILPDTCGKIISLTTDNGFHSFEEIRINTDLKKSLTTSSGLILHVRSLFYDKDLSLNKVFLIKKLSINNKTFYNVIFDMDTINERIYFSEGNQHFKLHNQKSDVFTTTEKNYVQQFRYKQYLQSLESPCYNMVPTAFIQNLETLHQKHPYFIPDTQHDKLKNLKLWWNNLSDKQKLIIKIQALSKMPPVVVCSDSYEFSMTILNHLKKYWKMQSLEYLKKLEDERAQKALYGVHYLLNSKM